MRSLGSLLGLNTRGIASGLLGQRRRMIPKNIPIVSLFGVTSRVTYPSIYNIWKNGVFGDMSKSNREARTTQKKFFMMRE